MEKANISGITRLRINEDGPGVRSVVFMCGCPLHCVWCCNPEVCLSTSYKTLSADELYQYIARDVPYFEKSGGGITFSGGEPLLHTAFISEFIQKHGSGFSAALETSLYTDASNIMKLSPLVDRWYIDFKVSDSQKHRKYTGVSNELIKSNLRFLSDRIDKEKITITYPVIPSLNTSDEDLSEMMTFLSDCGIKTIELHPYRKIQEQKHAEIGLSPTVIGELSGDSYRAIKERLTENGFHIPEISGYHEKEKCKYLKSIRKQICSENKIHLQIRDCKVRERCSGVCRQCEHELDVINNWRECHVRSIQKRTL